MTYNDVFFKLKQHFSMNIVKCTNNVQTMSLSFPLDQHFDMDIFESYLNAEFN